MKGITDTEIIVANSAPMSGPYIASGDPMNAGIRSYFDMVNAGGGIDGRNSVGYVDGQNLCDCAVPRGIFATGGQRTLRVYRRPLYGTARADDSTSENRV